MCSVKKNMILCRYYAEQYTSIQEKVVEMVVGIQLQNALDEADYLDLLFGFRLGYSTEMALFVLVDYLWRTWDRDDAIILALLELLATSDTIDHGFLLSQLLGWGVGMTGSLPFSIAGFSQCW